VSQPERQPFAIVANESLAGTLSRLPWRAITSRSTSLGSNLCSGRSPHARQVGGRALLHRRAGGAAGYNGLCFIDADMRASAQLIASAVDSATRDALCLLSLTPCHELLGFAERLIVPCGLYLLGFSQNLAQIQKPHSEDVMHDFA
jgi:hypothetical protein